MSLEIETYGEFWICTYKNINCEIRHNKWPVEIPLPMHNNWWVFYIILNIDRFSQSMRYLFKPDFYHKNGNLLDELPWPGGITYYDWYSKKSIKVGCDYLHAEHIINHEKYDFKQIQIDLFKCIDVLHGTNEYNHKISAGDPKQLQSD